MISDKQPPPTRPTKFQMLVYDTKIRAFLKPTAWRICPRLSITANPDPAPSRNDNQINQKSALANVGETRRMNRIMVSKTITLSLKLHKILDQHDADEMQCEEQANGVYKHEVVTVRWPHLVVTSNRPNNKIRPMTTNAGQTATMKISVAWSGVCITAYICVRIALLRPENAFRMPTAGLLLFGKFWMQVTSEAVLKYVEQLVRTKRRTHI